MGKPKKVEAAKIGENYNWGKFGGATATDVNLSDTANANVMDAQSGVSQYLNELLNPSYNSQSFRARQDIIDQNNQQFANELGAAAIARGARGSATQNILNSIMANRNNDLRAAMAQEDSRVANILNAALGVEGNYFNQANTMANNILARSEANAGRQQQVNAANAANYNAWRNNLISAGTALGGAAVGSYLAPGSFASNFGGFLLGNNKKDEE